MYERPGRLKGIIGVKSPLCWRSFAGIMSICRLAYHKQMARVGVTHWGESQRSLKKGQIMSKSLTFPVDGVTLPPCHMGFARSFDDHHNRSSQDLLVVVRSVACFESLDEH